MLVRPFPEAVAVLADLSRFSSFHEAREVDPCKGSVPQPNVDEP